MATIAIITFIAVCCCTSTTSTCTSFVMALSSSATARFLAQRPFLQQIIGKSSSSSQHTPKLVLSFFFGVDYNDPVDVQKNLVQGYCLDQGSGMSDMWFGGGDEYDKLCRETFSETIRQVGGGGSREDGNANKNWQAATIDASMARLILCDQISRNAFRATPEAFAYEKPALDVARQLAQITLLLKQHGESLPPPETNPLHGEIFPPYKSFIVTTLMHSESVDDHDYAMQVLKQAQLEAANADQKHLQAWWDYQITFELEHKNVIDRFGRYPHRNTLKKRKSTPEEVAWLADTEHLPAWALSQVVNREPKEDGHLTP